jgi:hypothetical protein
MKTQPRKWAAEIHAWAYGKYIQCKYVGPQRDGGDIWRDCSQDIFWDDEDYEYRVKPEPGYPVSRMSDVELCQASECATTLSIYNQYRNVANAAIKQAVIDGQVVLPKDTK